jgi:predicted enzyme related to lactoylglutathione lyase
MSARIVHFDIGCRNKAESADFYADLFGWEIGAGANEFALAIEGAGLGGQIVSLGHEPHNYVMFYVEVDNIAATVAAAEAKGGAKLVGPAPLPDGRRFAWLKDPEGTLVGIMDRNV